MDLTYLIVAVFGMCVMRPCRSLPTAAAAAAAASAPTPTPSETSLQVAATVTAAAEPTNNSKRSRSLFQSPPSQYHHLYDDVMDDLPFYLQQQQQQQQLHQQHHQQDPIDENGLRADDDDDESGLSEDAPSSRARPSKPDSPVYFIRLPPQPYMYVPGYGYVSQPTRLEPPPFEQRPHSPFLNLPLGFVSNGKPVGIYTLPQQQQQYQPPAPQYQPPVPQYQPAAPQYQPAAPQYQPAAPLYQQPSPDRPKPNRRPQIPSTTPRPHHRPSPPPPSLPVQQQRPDSPIYNLDKGPYVFNGRPTDVFLLQNAYDTLYSEVLQNIYP